jgi:hypothetical protein
MIFKISSRQILEYASISISDKFLVAGQSFLPRKSADGFLPITRKSPDIFSKTFSKTLYKWNSSAIVRP